MRGENVRTPLVARLATALSLLLLVGCDPSESAFDAGGRDARPSDSGPAPLCDPTPPGPFPPPDMQGENRGPGLPDQQFNDEALFQNCAFLDGGETDVTDHHNLVTMYDGYLMMPWAPEWGTGGITFWDLSDPCRPAVVGSGTALTIRETHSIGFSQLGGRWAAVNTLRAVATPGRVGIEFWDIGDVTAPERIRGQWFEEAQYPDAYARVTLSLFWQVPYVYAATADLGVHIVEARDPDRPEVVGNYRFDPVMRAGQVQAIGNLLIVTEAEGPRVVLLDISEPESPQPIAGGDFLIRDRDGEPRGAYFSNYVGGFLYNARKDSGGGIIVYDLRDPSRPTFAGDIVTDGNGGYVFVHEGRAFVGESEFAAIYDVSDLTNIREIARLDLEGDLDTITPLGNLAVLSVDDDAEEDRGSAIAPVAEDPDRNAPQVQHTWPVDGAEELPLTSRIGIGFNEFVDVLSAHEGSVRLYRADRAPDEGRVATVVSVQETLVNVHPRCPLEPETDYTLELMAGGVRDFSGNALAQPVMINFRTGP